MVLSLLFFQSQSFSTLVMTFLSLLILLETVVAGTIPPTESRSNFRWNLAKEDKFPMTDRDVDILLRYDARVGPVTQTYWKSRSNGDSIPRALRRAMRKEVISDDPKLTDSEKRFASLFLPQLH